MNEHKMKNSEKTEQPSTPTQQPRWRGGVSPSIYDVLSLQEGVLASHASSLRELSRLELALEMGLLCNCFNRKLCLTRLRARETVLACLLLV